MGGGEGWAALFLESRLDRRSSTTELRGSRDWPRLDHSVAPPLSRPAGPRAALPESLAMLASGCSPPPRGREAATDQAVPGTTRLGPSRALGRAVLGPHPRPGSLGRQAIRPELDDFVRLKLPLTPIHGAWVPHLGVGASPPSTLLQASPSHGYGRGAPGLRELT